MPDPKTCAARGLIPGTKEYEDCVSYKGNYAGGKAKKPANPVKGSLKTPAGGGY